MGCGGSKTDKAAAKEVKTVDVGGPTVALNKAAAQLKGATNSDVDVFISKLAPDVREKLITATAPQKPLTLDDAIHQLSKATEAELVAFLSDRELRERLQEAGIFVGDGNALQVESQTQPAKPVVSEPNGEQSTTIESNEAGLLVAMQTLGVNGSKATESDEVAVVDEAAEVPNARVTGNCVCSLF